jgi:outer membrane protein OmpA-like peptidoglycan-associated protein
VLGVVAVSAAAWWVARDVEDELTIRARAALAAAGIPVAVDYDGRDARLHGSVADSGAAARAAEVVDGVPGTRSVVSDIRVDPPGSAPASATPPPATPPAGTPTPTVAPDAAPTGTPAPSPASEPPPLPPATVRFGDAAAEVPGDARATLDAVADHLLRYPAVRVVVEGHTDGTGTPESNWRLSRQRAEAVRTALADRGVPADRMEIALYADTRPVASDDTAEGRAANRRVEIVAVTP